MIETHSRCVAAFCESRGRQSDPSIVVTPRGPILYPRDSFDLGVALVAAAIEEWERAAA